MAAVLAKEEWRLRPGRPIVEAEIRNSNYRLSTENPLCGAPRIHGSLFKLGYDVAEATVGKYMAKRPGLPSQSWRTFVNNRSEIAAIDFLTVPLRSVRSSVGWNYWEAQGSGQPLIDRCTVEDTTVFDSGGGNYPGTGAVLSASESTILENGDLKAMFRP